MLTVVCVCDGIGIAILLMLLVTNIENFNKMMKTSYLLKLIIVTIITCIADILAFVFDGKPGTGYKILLYIINSWIFLAVVMDSYYWVRLDSDCIGAVISKKGKLFLSVFSCVGLAAVFVNIFYPIVFSLDNNIYIRESLYWIYVAIGASFIGYGHLIYFKAKNEGRIVIPFSAVVFSLPMLIGITIQSLFYGVSLIWVSIAISILGVFSYIKNNLVYVDPLTRVYNMQYLYKAAVAFEGNNKLDITGIMLDINDFKNVNDTFGREIGNRILVDLGGILTDAIKGNGSVIRYGGDEFVVLMYTNDTDVVSKAIAKIREDISSSAASKLNGQNLSLSIGWEIYNKDQSFDDFILDISQLMKQEKQKYREIHGKADIDITLGSIPLTQDILKKSNIGLYAIENDEGMPPRLYIDDTMRKMFGINKNLSPEESYNYWYNNIDSDYLEILDNCWDKMVMGESTEVQYKWHHPDGHIMIARDGAFCNYEYGDGIRVEGTHQDVTDIAHFDMQELEHQIEKEKSLAEQQRRLKSFGSMVNAALWNMDIIENNEIATVIWSNEFRSMLGFDETEEDFPNTIEAWSSRLHPDDKDRALKQLYEGIKSTDYENYVYDTEYRMFKKNGDISWYHAVGRLEEKENGQKEIYGIFYDISADKQLEEQQKETERALALAESASKAKTEFLFNMSHDIRTPMNAILGYSNIALHHEDDSQKVHDSLKKIKSSGGHLLSLINDILEMSRIEAGKMELVESPIYMYDVVENVANMSRSLAMSKDVNFSTSFGEINNPYFFADELHINQVLINLISNAIKYTPAGGDVEYRVEQISNPVDGIANYRFTVKDNGIGMSEEFQTHLFESFSRENNATISKQEGAGLGLAIVKKIVDIANGTITVQSKKGEGSTFVVELPFRIMNESEIEEYNKAQADNDIIPDNIDLKGKKVLVVEDNEINRDISYEILSDIGLKVDVAEDGNVAVSKVAEKGAKYYDYILMDIQMPVMNGYEATAEIRKLPDGNAVPIIALSANAFREDVAKSLESGMNAHISKPINVNQLLQTMQNLVC